MIGCIVGSSIYKGGYKKQADTAAASVYNLQNDYESLKTKVSQDDITVGNAEKGYDAAHKTKDDESMRKFCEEMLSWTDYASYRKAMKGASSYAYSATRDNFIKMFFPDPGEKTDSDGNVTANDIDKKHLAMTFRWMKSYVTGMDTTGSYSYIAEVSFDLTKGKKNKLVNAVDAVLGYSVDVNGNVVSVSAYEPGVAFERAEDLSEVVTGSAISERIASATVAPSEAPSDTGTQTAEPEATAGSETEEKP